MASRRRESTDPALYQMISVPDDKQRLLSVLTGEGRTSVLPHHHQRGRPGIGFHAVARKDSHRCEAIAKRLSGARIHGVRHTRSVVLDPVAIVARSCHGYIGKLQ